jgi:hypothetical protein
VSKCSRERFKTSARASQAKIRHEGIREIGPGSPISISVRSMLDTQYTRILKMHRMPPILVYICGKTVDGDVPSSSRTSGALDCW